MAKILPIIVLFFTMGCVFPHTSRSSKAAAEPTTSSTSPNPLANREGWHAIGNEFQPLANLPVVTPVETERQRAAVRVTNVGTSTLTYYSAGPTNIQTFQELRKDGEWKAAEWDWCGTGKSRYSIRPGQSVVLEVQFWAADDLQRMSGIFTEEGTERRAFVLLATQPRR